MSPYTESAKNLSPADPTKKMSKSLGAQHFIGLFESEESIRKKIRSSVTDSDNESNEMIFEMSSQARKIAQGTIREVRELTGLLNMKTSLMKS